jgi:hypothetical protein
MSTFIAPANKCECKYKQVQDCYCHLELPGCKHGDLVHCKQCKIHGLRKRKYCSKCTHLLLPRNWTTNHEEMDDAHPVVKKKAFPNQRELVHNNQTKHTGTPLVNPSVLPGSMYDPEILLPNYKTVNGLVYGQINVTSPYLPLNGWGTAVFTPTSTSSVNSTLVDPVPSLPGALPYTTLNDMLTNYYLSIYGWGAAVFPPTSTSSVNSTLVDPVPTTLPGALPYTTLNTMGTYHYLPSPTSTSSVNLTLVDPVPTLPDALPYTTLNTMGTYHYLPPPTSTSSVNLTLVGPVPTLTDALPYTTLNTMGTHHYLPPPTSTSSVNSTLVDPVPTLPDALPYTTFDEMINYTNNKEHKHPWSIQEFPVYLGENNRETS